VVQRKLDNDSAAVAAGAQGSRLAGTSRRPARRASRTPVASCVSDDEAVGKRKPDSRSVHRVWAVHAPRDVAAVALALQQSEASNPIPRGGAHESIE
jgi:hypothetical protein